MLLLKLQANKEGASVNSLMLKLIDQGLGKLPVKQKRARFDDLNELAASWSSEALQEFERVTSGFSEIDDSLWR